MSTTTFDPELCCPDCGRNVGNDTVIDFSVSPDNLKIFVYTENGHQIVQDLGSMCVRVYCAP